MDKTPLTATELARDVMDVIQKLDGVSAIMQKLEYHSENEVISISEMSALKSVIDTCRRKLEGICLGF